MKTDELDRLTDFVLGILPEDEQRQVRDLVDASPALQREVALLTETLASAAADLLPPLVPSKATRARLMESLAGPDRFAPFFALLARKFDLAIDAVRTLLAKLDDPAAWEDGPFPGVRLIHFAPGPSVSAADAGFVQLAAGLDFPRHRHLGDELTIVLEGTMIDGGRVYGPGSVIELGADAVHEYTAGPERALVIMVAHNGIETAGL